MALINVTKENLDKEHICCAITEKKGETCVADKKAWLADRLSEGLVFKRLDARGKVLIEYIPAEYAWYPIDAPGYMHIDCFWVSGQFKGRGYGKQLLEACIQDAKEKGKKGLTVLVGDKKRPFLTDGAYLKRHGFLIADTAAPYFRLLYLPFDKDAEVPAFRPQAKEGKTGEPGMVLYYTNQCPYSNTYALRIQAVAEKHGEALKLIQLQTRDEVQLAPTPYPTYSLFIDGAFYTQEVQSVSKFEALLDKRKVEKAGQAG